MGLGDLFPNDAFGHECHAGGFGPGVLLEDFCDVEWDL